MPGSGFDIGKIFGIQISIDWSWILIFLLVTWNLGVAFNIWHPEWSLAMVIGLAVLASLLFFGSVLAHELAHSLVARSRGIPVRRITLFLFGGVSNITREPSSAGVEFLVAIVGPLTSIVLGLVLTVIGVALAGRSGVPTSTSGLASLDAAATILLWLGPINLLLGVFNLIPGFPLDGGRVLRSVLWGITGNLTKATIWAARAGQAIGWLLIVVGVAMTFGASIPLLGTGFVAGLWLAFIGWFLQSAARQSYQQVLIQDVLEGVPVSRLMEQNVPTVDADASVADLVHNQIMRTNLHAFPVLRGSDLVGLVSLDDVRKIGRPEWETTRVAQIMTPSSQLETASPDEEASDALNQLAARDVNQLPVMQDGHLVGLLRRSDILRWLQLQNVDRAAG